MAKKLKSVQVLFLTFIQSFKNTFKQRADLCNIWFFITMIGSA